MEGEAAPPASGDRKVGQGIVESDLVRAPPGDTLRAEDPPLVIHLGLPQVQEVLQCDQQTAASSASPNPGSCLVVIQEEELAEPQGAWPCPGAEPGLQGMGPGAAQASSGSSPPGAAPDLPCRGSTALRLSSLCASTGEQGHTASLCSMVAFSASWDSGSKAGGIQAPLKPALSA